jgi:NhaP-type Na+/H+ or K+/H+ antiporter
MALVLRQFSSSSFVPDPNDLMMVITNAMYEVLFGLILGVTLGFQKQSDQSQFSA